MESNLAVESSRIPRRLSISDQSSRKLVSAPLTTCFEHSECTKAEIDTIKFEEVQKVANQLAEKLEALREFSNVEREIWKQDIEKMAAEKFNCDKITTTMRSQVCRSYLKKNPPQN